MPIVGAFARVEVDGVDQTRRRLDGLAGVETFDLDDAGKVGLLIETTDLDSAHALLTKTIPEAEGVLGVWPIYLNDEDDPEQQSRPSRPS